MKKMLFRMPGFDFIKEIVIWGKGPPLDYRIALPKNGYKLVDLDSEVSLVAVNVLHLVFELSSDRTYYKFKYVI